MADNNSYKQTPRRRGPGGGMAPAEKAKNFKGSISKLMQYIGRYKIAILAVMIMAAASTVFTAPASHRRSARSPVFPPGSASSTRTRPPELRPMS